MIPGDRWREVTPSRFAHELAGLAAVRAALPDAEPYRAWANLEIVTDRGRCLEVDLLVLGPAGLYLVELKAWSGRITGDRYTWTIRGERTTTIDNPYPLANSKARELKSLVTAGVRRIAEERGLPKGALAVPYVQAAVLLHGEGVRCELAPVERTFLYGLDGATERTGLPGIGDLLTAPPPQIERAITGRHAALLAAVMDRIGITRRRQRTVLGYRLEELAATGPGWEDYRASHAKVRSELARVRVYHTGRATTAEERARLDHAAHREYRMLRHVRHPGLLAPTHFDDTEYGPALVYPLEAGDQRLDLYLAAHPEGLPVQRQLAIIRSLAETVQYAHGRRITHRALNPASVVVRAGADGEPTVLVTDWQTAARAPLEGTLSTAGVPSAASGTTVLAGTRHLAALVDSPAQAYLAPEVTTGAPVDPVRVDVFGLGALAALIVTGRPPAASADALRQRLSGEHGIDLAGQLPGVPEPLRALVLDATRGDVAARMPDLATFLERLGGVEAALAPPEAEVEQVNPLEAGAGALLAGRFEVVRRLGAGSSAVALLVLDRTTGTLCVLKIARDASASARLDDEAEALRGLADPRVVRLLVDGTIDVGGHAAIVLDHAGDDTLARRIHARGRLSLDRLERFGADLLGALAYLDRNGVDHRDVKPDNLGVRERPADRTEHLVLFDFSLSRAPAADVTAGTPPYLDPFLGRPGRGRWDGAAERYAAAVTLFEMATGRTPAYGDGLSDPAVVDAGPSVDPGLFDPAVAEAMVAFFTRALARDAAQRQASLDDMRQAWAVALDTAATATAGARDPDELAVAATATTPLAEAGLTPRALSALEPLGLTTVADLLAVPGVSLSRLSGVNEATRREIRARRRAWRDRLGAPGAPGAPGGGAPGGGSGGGSAGGAAPTPAVPPHSVDAVVAALVPRGSGRSATRVHAARLLLGLAADPDDAASPLPPPWLSHGQLGELLAVTRVRAQQLAADLRGAWAADTGLAGVRDDLVALAEDRGGVLTAEEAAASLLAARGSVHEPPQRGRQALGLVRAAVEAELERGGDARLDRGRRGERVIIAREAEPDDPSGPVAGARIDHAADLGREADRLVWAGDTPVLAPRALAALRAVTTPAGMPPLDDARLLRLAAAASADAAVSGRDELYRRAMPAQAALRHSGAAFATPDGRTDERSLRERVQARFPAAQPLPDRPALDGLLAAAGSLLVWEPERRLYVTRQVQPYTAITSQRPATLGVTGTQPYAPVGPDEVDLRLQDSLDLRSFLALGVDPAWLDRAPALLAERFGVALLDVTGVLLDRMRELAAAHRIPWDLVLAADAAEPRSTDGQGLRGLVGEAMGAVDAAVRAAGGALLLTDAEPLARYGHLDMLARLADQAEVRPAARWLLVPASDDQPSPLLDRSAVPVLSSVQWLRLPRRWLAESGARA